MNVVEALLRTLPQRQRRGKPTTTHLEPHLEGLTRCRNQDELDLLLLETVRDERLLSSVVQAIREALADLPAPMSSAGPHVDMMASILESFDPVQQVLDQARQQAEQASLLGVASPYHDTLSLRPSTPRREGLPPAEVMTLVTERAKEPLARLWLVYLALVRPQLPLWFFAELARTVGRGYEAHLRHLASLGYGPATGEVPRDLLDMEALYTQAEPTGEFTLDQLVARLDLPAPQVEEAIAQRRLDARLVGVRHQVDQAHLRAFQQTEQARRQAAVDELTAEAQALGLYDL